MGISKNEFEFECNKLEDTLKWIGEEKTISEADDRQLQNKIDALKKEARGRYNEELETSQKLKEVTEKNLQKYTEALTKPYFARIDFREYRREKESFYIGKFGLGDRKTGDEIVIDWRAPLSELYYSGTEGEVYYVSPSGVINGTLSLKRKFLIRDSKLLDAFDEGINDIILKNSSEGSELLDEYLRINLEESVSGKLKDVVATIQKEQNAIIRSEKNAVLIVQGSAGSGKTTIALHRLAYLLYKHKNTMNGQDVLVIAPNKLFLDYIKDLLPNLGVDEVRQSTFEKLSMDILGIKFKLFSKDQKLIELIEQNNMKDEQGLRISKFKGTIEFKNILDSYIDFIEKKDLEISEIEVNGYCLFNRNEIKRLFGKDMIRFPLNKRKDEIKKYLKLKLKERINNICDKIDFTFEYAVARIKKSMEDSAERRQELMKVYDDRDNKKSLIRKNSLIAFDDYFEKWKHGSIVDIYYNLFKDESIFNEVTKSEISKELLTSLQADILNFEKQGIIDADDLGALLYIKFKVDEIPKKCRCKHLVLDEAQDYSPLQFEVLKMLSESNSFTIVGDLGQGIYSYRGIENWGKLSEEVFEGDAVYTTLTQSYRSTVEIIEFANKVLLKQNNALKPAMPVIRHGKKPETMKVMDDKDFAVKVDKIAEVTRKEGRKSIAIICKTLLECRKVKESLKKHSQLKFKLIKDTDEMMNSDYIIIPSYMSKGLEFDCTIVADAGIDVYTEVEMDKKLLYVVLTRALHEEYIFYRDEITSLIS